MVRFIKEGLLFVTICCLVTISMDFLTNQYVQKKADFKFRTKINHLVMGHSHPACAFNDSLISNLKNISLPGESYFYTFYKTREILKHNVDVKNIFIQYEASMLDNRVVNKIWGNSYLDDGLNIFGPFLSYQEKHLIISNNTSGFISFTFRDIPKRLIRMFKKDYNYLNQMGGYSRRGGNISKEYLENIRKTRQADPIDEYSEFLVSTEIEYLNKTIALCKSQNIKVFLIRSPVQELYLNYYPKVSIHQKIIETHNEIELLDFTSFPLSYSELSDFEHLNHKGAAKFSIWFNELIENEFLSRVDKQLYIDKLISELN